jgi:hypothetical protein
MCRLIVIRKFRKWKYLWRFLFSIFVEDWSSLKIILQREIGMRVLSVFFSSWWDNQTPFLSMPLCQIYMVSHPGSVRLVSSNKCGQYLIIGFMVLILSLDRLLGWELLSLFGRYGYLEMITCFSNIDGHIISGLDLFPPRWSTISQADL